MFQGHDLSMTSGVAFECGFAQKSNISLRISATSAFEEPF
jgi:hypothetical protein